MQAHLFVTLQGKDFLHVGLFDACKKFAFHRVKFFESNKQSLEPCGLVTRQSRAN